MTSFFRKFHENQNPDVPLTKENLDETFDSARRLFLKEGYKEAAVLFERILEFDQDNIEAATSLMMCYTHLKDKRKSESEKRFLELAERHKANPWFQKDILKGLGFLQPRQVISHFAKDPSSLFGRSKKQE